MSLSIIMRTLAPPRGYKQELGCFVLAGKFSISHHSVKMPLLRGVSEMLCIAYNFQYNDEVEFALLYDINKSKNPYIPYWQYNTFDLENMTDDESRTEFRFEKDHLFNLVESLQLDEEQAIYN